MAATSLDSKDVVIASAYGRGHWLASHLNDQGWKVALLDFTDSLGDFSSADYDGPFGLLQPDLISASQKTYWSHEFGENSVTEVSGGYTLWLKEGPLEGRGPLTTFLAQEHSLSLSVRNYLHMVSDLSDVRLKNERVQLSKLSFSQTWLAALMHQLHSNVYALNHQALESEHASPFFSNYSIRKVAPTSHSHARRFLKAKNVEVINAGTLDAVLIEHDELVTIGFDSKPLASRSFVSTLSSHEMSKVGSQVMRSFFPKGEVAKTWVWERFVVEISVQTDEVPEAFVILQDPHLPWTHTNIIVVHKNNKQWNCWLRLPASQASEPNYLSEQAAEIAKVINERLPWINARATHGGASLPRWFLFDQGEKFNLKSQLSKNVFASGPENWSGLDPLSRMLSHKEVIVGLETIRKVWDLRQLKREEKELKRINKEKEREERKRE